MLIWDYKAPALLKLKLIKLQSTQTGKGGGVAAAQTGKGGGVTAALQIYHSPLFKERRSSSAKRTLGTSNKER